MQLGGHQGAGQRRVGVAVDQDRVRTFVLHDAFQFDQHAAGHLAVAASVYVQLMLGLLHAEFVEEHIRHVGVEVLARMDQHFG
ncbi:hypothetical protein G6F35_018963 [Rhizopus arrhizus]|nr:hypothetical protein G6F35_018963 [Rhizopus arrhizus]KAG1224842.1 hypothetical protein G6F68_020041 [Rhizopus microsporus]